MILLRRGGSSGAQRNATTSIQWTVDKPTNIAAKVSRSRLTIGLPVQVKMRCDAHRALGRYLEVHVVQNVLSTPWTDSRNASHVDLTSNDVGCSEFLAAIAAGDRNLLGSHDSGNLVSHRSQQC